MVDSAKKEFGGSDGGSFGRTIDDFTFTDSQNRRGNTSLPTAAQTGGVSGSDILNAITSIFSPKGDNSGRGGWLSAFGQYGGNSDIQMDEFTNPTVTTKYNEKKSSDENAPTTAEEARSRGTGNDAEYGEYTKTNEQAWDDFRNAYVDKIIELYGDGNGNISLTTNDLNALDSIGKVSGSQNENLNGFSIDDSGNININPTDLMKQILSLNPLYPTPNPNSSQITYSDGSTGYMYSFPMDGLGNIVLSNGDVIDNQWFEDNGLLSLYNDVMQTGRYDQSAGSRSMLGLTPDSYAGGNFLQSNSSPFLGQQNAYGSNQGVSYLTADQLNSIDSQNLTSRDGKNVIKYGNMAIPTMAFLERVDPAAYAALADAAEYGSYQY